MPVKRRNPKRRTSGAAEMEAWSVAFTTGYDFFSELADFGLATTEQVRAEMPEAWRRLGSAFLAKRDEREDRTPWAIEQFGEPRHAG